MATGLRYAGRVAVVTGGSRGIGEGIVRAFVDQGARVVFCDKDEAAGQALELALREANTPGEAVFVLCDVTREEELQTLFSETLRRFGRLDCLVNNAGRHPGPERIEETTAQEFRDLLELNLLGYYTASKLALPYLRQTQGNIINISSLVAIIGQREAVPYVATKGAVTAMTKALAIDEGQNGVRVNCISPGNIWTPLWKELAQMTPDLAKAVREGEAAQVLGRLGTPAEVGAAAMFLAAEGSFCSGVDLPLSGGAELGYGPKALTPLVSQAQGSP
ncbi:17-beta-hydroxysteroid dehydrogenase 14 [Ornithorhynchus anatinus]|nr:17-beta-hydroxysteroid dehydrogenase 14 [Ornithorhynchus anatinus]